MTCIFTKAMAIYDSKCHIKKRKSSLALFGAGRLSLAVKAPGPKESGTFPILFLF